MPAAAVIPAPIAYIKVVAVKKLVVGFLVEAAGQVLVILYLALLPFSRRACLSLSCRARDPRHLL